MSLLKKIAFQGEPGANSHEACRTYFPDYEAYPCKTFEEAFEAIKSGVAQLGMIPIENSIAGRVADVHHLLPASGLKIIGERFKPIRFQLMANKGVKLEDIKVVSSMPIALSQCRNSLKRLGVETEAAGDTAGAAKALALKPNPTHAAVAPALAAEIDLQLDLGLQAADRGAVDRLHPRHGRSRRRDHPPEEAGQLRRPAPCAHRLPRRHGSFAGLHGRGPAL